MNIVLLQTQLSLQDIEQLLQEFPHYLFLSFTEATYKNLSQDNWSQVEIIYGTRLAPEELAKAHQLHWVHCPDKDINRLCMNEIKERGNIIVTSVREENLRQIGEFVFTCTLAFSKNLFHFYDINHTPAHVWDSKWRDSMLTLYDKHFLQIGLGKPATEITRVAQQFGMRVWGMDSVRSFHPHCHQTFSYQELNTILPKADVICLTLPKTKEFEKIIGRPQLEMMKENAILILLGNPKAIDETALIEVASKGKFKGILIDSMYQTPIPPQSPLWKLPNILITPEVSPRPKTREGQSFAVFRYNMRQYVHGNFKDMRNVVTQTVIV